MTRYEYFNPRTPHGVRQLSRMRITTYLVFQSTHPHGVRLRSSTTLLRRLSISIHAPLTGCDSSSLLPATRSSNFNPRTPHGVRLQTCIKEVIPIWLLEQYIDMFLRISSFILFFFVPTGKLLYNNLPFWSANLLCKTCVPHPRTA